jgi:hypothetical protein
MSARGWKGRRHHAWRRLGRRGTALLFLCFIDLIFAYGYLWPGPRDTWSPSMEFVATVAPLPVWALLWGAVGLVCLQQAFRDNDKVGFGCAVMIKVLWALLHLLGTLVGDLDRGHLYIAVWMAGAGWVWIISTWPEPAWPNDPPPVVPTTPSDPSGV